MAHLLDGADEQQGALTFIVVLPRWPKQSCWRDLAHSPHATLNLTLPRSKHAYIDGGQQYGRRHTAWRLSNHDSSVVFLQSAKAKALTPVTAAKQARLLEAFGTESVAQISAPVASSAVVKKRRLA